MVPHFAGRLASPLEDPGRAAVMAGLSAEPVDYFRRFFADTALFGNAHAVRCAVEFFGAGHVLFGTDMPLGPTNAVAATIADLDAAELSGEDLKAVYVGNAMRLLGLPSGGG